MKLNVKKNPKKPCVGLKEITKTLTNPITLETVSDQVLRKKINNNNFMLLRCQEKLYKLQQQSFSNTFSLLSINVL